ncbi:hypothetical protein WKH50_03380 [Pantoea agglomerans]|uniref:hypothetical protein n=1 Tax=Enterobacter agglomerans TaxID=549 RepID=UPI003C7D91C9
MINPDDIKVGMVLGQADAMILRAAVARLNVLELEILALRKGREIPEGWKLVPVEPTPEMLEEIWLDERFKEMAMKRRYYALLAAAPTPHE